MGYDIHKTKKNRNQSRVAAPPRGCDKYNMDIAPDRTSLSNLEKRDKESMREYAQR
jgi:hypothetical protein